MPRPINYPISPDAPDSENPDLSVKLKVGPPRMKAPKPKGITKSDPQDAGVFTQEKLKRFGGTMRDIPQGMDGAMKKGGKVKKYADGGDIDADFGARNEGPAGDDSYTPAPKAEPKTRGEAFRAARTAGDKTFEFEGKKYTTDLAKPKAKEEAPKSVKSPGIMQRMRDKDTAMVKSAQSKTRQSNADLGAGNAGPSGTGGRLTGDRMSPAYGQGRVNPDTMLAMKKGGAVKKYASGGSVSSRADGCAQRGKTKGMMR